MRIAILTIILLSLVLLPAGGVLADVIAPDADTYISSSGSNTNYGADPSMWIKEITGQSFRRKAYIRFDLADLSFYGSGSAGSATLTLNFIDSAVGTAPSASTPFVFAVYGLIDQFSKAGKLNEDWAETGTGSITWSNAPGNVSGAGLDWENIYDGSSTTSGVKLATFTLMGKGVGTVTLDSATFPDLLAFINDELNDASPNDDGLVTLIVLRETSEETAGSSYVHAIASDEHSTVDGPSLEVVAAPVPEPATLGLLAIGGLALAGGRKLRRGI